jgi:hypothetical protein
MPLYPRQRGFAPLGAVMRRLDRPGRAAYGRGVMEKSLEVLALASPSDEATHDENGVDLTLIRAYLDMTPIERLRSLQNAARAIEQFRPIKSSKPE